MPIKEERIELRLPAESAGQRLDQVLADLLRDFSRSRIQSWAKEGRVAVDGIPRRPRDKVLGGERVEIQALFEEEVECRPQAIGLNLVHQDAAILVIDKPVGLVVHPAAGNPDGTLQNALLHFDPELIHLPRAGIVHRLDKETSGLLVVARTPAAHRHLVEQLQAREIHREYRAVAQGVMTAGGTVDEPLGRHPSQRTKMAVVRSGKPAVTHYRVLERFKAHTYLMVKLETGRTHQIRVHMAHIRFPLIGDPAYGGRLRIPAGASDSLAETLRRFKRQALHAHRLGLHHPLTGEWLEWESPLPKDMRQLLDELQIDAELPKR
ncbi:MAG: 23S rRNA pseudouridine(1911/1915/1917) synthase RluD [Gammaproteobacteria bacterium]|nr:23S rRNA pseudouridine(1911/1915/1917) synthase RluD [Gammaproteobacteria bacterium]MBU1653530.1 23S rRNA pseudouridine(1911/1915/1917) synthase RluD [Gammaproteobacteria bacterium]MBU1961652.1 23S rRNA pseudouridine(1911/1915/1917) synthase RluD [Gammaproteobacteria bacterium]